VTERTFNLHRLKQSTHSHCVLNCIQSGNVLGKNMWRERHDLFSRAGYDKHFFPIGGQMIEATRSLCPIATGYGTD
jgi:hypothetical protein